MSLTERAASVSDLVTAELIECAPDAATPVTPPAGQDVPPASPTQKSGEATLESTGADPPPAVSRG